MIVLYVVLALVLKKPADERPTDDATASLGRRVRTELRATLRSVRPPLRDPD